MTTNKIEFSNDKSFLIPFIKTIFKKENKIDKLIHDEFYEMLKMLIAKTPKCYKESRKCSVYEIRIELPNWKWINTQYNNFISEKNKIILLDWLSKKFFFLFHTFMTNQKDEQFQDAIYKFIEIYNLPIETFEMLKKRDYRYRKLIKNKFFTSQNKSSLSCGLWKTF